MKDTHDTRLVTLVKTPRESGGFFVARKKLTNNLNKFNVQALSFPAGFQDKSRAMKKVLIDSSVWVSLFAGDKNYGRANNVISQIMGEDRLIIVPTLVYVEVINALHRLRVADREIIKAQKVLLKSKMVHLCHTTSGFWLNEVVYLSETVRLGTHDLVILAHALKYRADLITFDKEMDMTYIKNRNNNLL